MKICAITLPARLSEHDILSLCEQLRLYSSKWREIGTGLRFTASELSTIQASPAHFMSAPCSYLEAMLALWQQWIPGDSRGSKNYATLESLKTAIAIYNLECISFCLSMRIISLMYQNAFYKSGTRLTPKELELSGLINNTSLQ